MDTQAEITKLVLPLLSGLALLVVSWVGAWVREALGKYVATCRNAQEISILVDACRTVIARKAQEKKIRYAEMIADLHLDAQELDEIKRDVLEIANESLAELRGYIVEEGMKRLSGKVDFILGELQTRFLGRVKPSEIGPDSEAQT